MSSSAKTRFAAVVQPHFDALYRTAFRLTRQVADAEDLLQDVCLRAFGRLDELESVTDTRAWLLRVQFRLFVDGRRRRQRSPVRSFAADESDDTISAEQPGPEEQVAVAAEFAALSAAWLRLTREQQALLALHAEGYGLSEIAEITGVAKSALSARMYRARARLANAIGTDEPMKIGAKRAEG